jgi:hypothetical protein
MRHTAHVLCCDLEAVSAAPFKVIPECVDQALKACGLLLKVAAHSVYLCVCACVCVCVCVCVCARTHATLSRTKLPFVTLASDSEVGSAQYVRVIVLCACTSLESVPSLQRADHCCSYLCLCCMDASNQPPHTHTRTHTPSHPSLQMCCMDASNQPTHPHGHTHTHAHTHLPILHSKDVNHDIGVRACSPYVRGLGLNPVDVQVLNDASRYLQEGV